MARLFGGKCSTLHFRHDEEMRKLHGVRETDGWDEQTQTTFATPSPQMASSSSPSHRIVNTPKSSHDVPMQENTKLHLRPFDAYRNEMPLGDVVHTPESTPRPEIIAVSPGSESQSLRRRVILEGLRDGRAKRPRLDLDGLNPALSRELTERPATFISDSTSPASAPGSEGNSEVTEQSRGEFWDFLDGVFRCSSCGHELWSIYGQCTGCAAGGEYPYFEVWDPEQGPLPELAHNASDTDYMSLDGREALVGDYLDFDSSAYDSHDEMSESGRNEDYELDSFIDDESQASNMDNSSSSDGETDWKEDFKELDIAHRSLIDDYITLADEHEEFRREILGSDTENWNDSEEYDEEGMHLVDVNVPDPVITEFVLSHAEVRTFHCSIAPIGLLAPSMSPIQS